MHFTKQIIPYSVLLFFCCAHPLFSQPNNLKISSFSWNEVIETSQINCIYQDKTGFIWFGTNNGLIRHDGYDFLLFEHIPGDSLTLSSSNIRDIAEDNTGNLWMATQEGGLNRLSLGTGEIKSWQNQPSNPNSLPDNDLNSLCVDSHGNIWIAMTFEGLVCYNPKIDSFRNFKFKPGIKENGIRNVYIDSQQRLWLSVFDFGLGVLDLKKYEINNLESKDFSFFMRANKLKTTSLYKIIEGSDNSIWITAKNVLHKLHVQSGNFVSYELFEPVLGNEIQDICRYDKNALLIAATHGVFYFNHGYQGNNFRLRKIEDITQANKQAPLQYINKIYIDRSQVIWLGTRDGPVKVQKQKFITRKPNPDINARNIVNCITSDKHGNIILGLWLGGLWKYNQHRNIHEPFGQTSYISNKLMSLLFDRQDLWIGTWDGLYKMNIGRTGFRHRKIHLASDLNVITRLLKDSLNNIWISSLGKKDSALFMVNTETNQINPLPTGANAISYPAITSMCFDKNGALWAGTNRHGLNKITKQGTTYNYKTYYFNPDNKYSLISNTVNTLFVDSKNRLWVGTHRGLSRMDIEKELFINYSTNQGLPDNMITNIVEDNDSNLWVSTRTAMCKLSSDTIKFVFYQEDGIEFDRFTPRSAYKDRNGKLYFGGEGGYITFYPENITISTYHPNVVLTGFWLSGEKVEPGKALDDDRILLDKNISQTRLLELEHDDKMIAFEFTALDFEHPQRIKYEYKMQGYDERWFQAEASDRRVVYKVVPPGEYTLLVKATNSDMVWNPEVTSLKIIVHPPYWATWWFRMLLLACILTLISIIHNIRLNYIKKQKIALQSKVDNKTKELKQAYNQLFLQKEEIQSQKESIEKLAQKEQEVNRMKLHFFTNISHEFRTPLALISAPVKKLLEQYTKDRFLHQQHLLISRNTDKLLRLVNQLINFRKIESGKMQLKVSRVNINHLAGVIFDSFSEHARLHHFQYSFYPLPNEHFVWADREKFEIVLDNLISNAFKFTPAKGTITLKIEIEKPNKDFIKSYDTKINKNYLQITVCDTGIGIAEDDQQKIFERFYQVQSNNPLNTGSGIGLSIVKEIVEAHHGFINIESRRKHTCNKQTDIPCGTTFTIWLPAGKSAYQSYEIIDPSETQNHFDVSDKACKETKQDKTVSSPPRNKQTILIVEDNAELLNYLVDLFSSDYNVTIAADGAGGLQKAIKEMPGIIISDIMMPRMDGIEMCKKIKQDLNTSHIPVILLTARADIEQRIEGLETGADDYIPKPFDARILEIRVKKLLELRQLLKEKYSNRVVTEPGKNVTGSSDELFYRKLDAIIEKNIEQNSLNVDFIAKQIGMSRRQFYRKMKAVSSIPLNDYIKNFRLQRAGQLIKESNYTISEIGYMLGFNTVNYFSRTFKEYYGSSPKKFRQDD